MMITNCDLIIKNGKVFEKNKFKKNHIVIKNGKIFKLTKNIKSFKSKKIIDADKKIVIPGIIDIHFHVRAPSFPQRGTVQSETKAAAKGGITTLFEMPISNPCMSNAKVLNYRKKHFDENTYINFAMIPALGKFNDKNLNGLINSGAIAFKVFTIAPPIDRKSEFEGLCFTEEKNILKALMHAKKSNLTTIFHAEDQALLDHFEKKQKNFKKNNPAMHNAMRPDVVEASAIEKILRLNSIVKTKVHIAHVTSELSLEVISKFKNKGQSITAETCPHYLFKNEKDVIKSGPFGKINPPIRYQKDQKKLWLALKNKTLDIIASDHASFSFKEKIKGKKNFIKSPPGAPSGELMLPLMLKSVSEKKIKLEKVIELMCINPAKRFNIFPNKGLIKRGSDADIVILDMNKKWTVDRNTLVSKGKNCAHLYFGEKIKGKINKTIVNGNVVYDGKKFYKNKNMNNFVSPIRKN